MKNRSYLIGITPFILLCTLATGCKQPDSTSQTGVSKAATSSSGSTTSTSTTTSSTSSSVNAIQIITKADPTGSFDAAAVPLAGGASVKAQRLYNLDGSLIATGSVPAWYYDSRIFLTSSRTSAGAPANTIGDTPCAYFDRFSSDTNPDSSGYYTIDGYTPGISSNGTDVDQCAGITASEANQLGFYFRLDRRYVASTDKLQVIVKMKMLDEPNTGPTASSCVVGGYFDAAACSNAYYTLTMRTLPTASAKPFFILFPSAKALDLLSESVLVPINIDTSITTISIDRVKGGAIFYGVTVIRLQ